MAFCGQCGDLLDPNAKKCPRCGAVVPGSDASPVQVQPGNRPSGEENYATMQSASQQETARAAGNDGDQGRIASNSTDWEQAFPGPTGSFYPPSYPNVSASVNPAFAHGSETYPDPATPPDHPMDYEEGPYRTPPPIPPRKKTSTALALAIIAFVFAIALTTTLLVMQPGGLGRLLGHTATATPTATSAPTAVETRTPEQQAQAVIERYFRNINQKSYQAAYKLWASPPSSYQDFVNGFAHTKRDDIQTGAITQQSNGTVQVPIVISALTDKDTKETFSGYYIVGQQPDGSWKITGAKVNPGTGS